MIGGKRVLFVTTRHSYFAEPIPNALRSLGFTVKVFDYYRPNLSTRILGVGETLKVFTGEKRQAINQALLSIVKAFRPDFLLLIKGETITSETIRKISGEGTTTINWFPDWLVSWKWIKKNAPGYDFFISVCLDTRRKLENNGIKSYYLPYGTEPDRPRQKLAKRYPIVFVGQYSHRREKYFKKIKDLDLKIWGYKRWERSSLKREFSGPTSTQEAKKIIRQATIVVNILTGSDRFQPEAVNVRTFETLGVGTFLLVKQDPILQRHFEVNRELVTFTSPDDLRKKAQYYLRHDKKRERIATAGYNRVLKDHTFEVRLKELFKIVKNHEHK